MTSVHIPDGYGLATLKWSYSGKTNPISTTVGYGVVLSSTGPAEVAQDLYTALTSSGTPCEASSMLTLFTFLGVECIQNQSGVMTGGASSGPPIVGTKSDSGGRMIMNTSLVVKKLTARIGRHYRGRFFWPITSMTEVNIDTLGMVDVVALATFQAEINQFYTNVGVSGLEIMDILHVDPALTPTAITSLLVEGQVGTQRRRMR